MKWIGRLHAASVHKRRVARLAAHLKALLPEGATVADIGSGDASLAAAVLAGRPDLQVQCFDVLAKPDSALPVTVYDGRRLPLCDGSVDIVLLIDVLHHTDDPLPLLREARRVAQKAVVVKDHLREGLFSGITLRLMDWVGNAPGGVYLPYNYLRASEWLTVFAKAELQVEHWDTHLRIYPWPVSAMLDRSLHVLAVLQASLPRRS